MAEQRKAVALISGGLDSMLAAKVMLEQGIHVEGINFFTGFCVEGHTHAIRRQDTAKPKRNNALWVAEQLGIKLHIVDVIEEYKDEFYEWVIFRKSSPALSTLKHSLETIKNDAIAINLKKNDQLKPQEVEEITSLMINKIVSKFATYLKDENSRAEMSIEVIEQVFK